MYHILFFHIFPYLQPSNIKNLPSQAHYQAVNVNSKKRNYVLSRINNFADLVHFMFSCRVSNSSCSAHLIVLQLIVIIFQDNTSQLGKYKELFANPSPLLLSPFPRPFSPLIHNNNNKFRYLNFFTFIPILRALNTSTYLLHNSVYGMFVGLALKVTHYF